MAEYFCKVAEHVRSDPIALKWYIFYEATNKRPPFPSFKTMCKKYGSDQMTYPDFEFWYMRFARGEFDFNYDRSKDPKMRGIQALPMEIIDKIGKNYLNLMERQILRKVSKYYRALVATWDPGFKFISLQVDEQSSTLWLDQFRINFQNFQKFDGFGNSICCNVHSGSKTKTLDYCTHLEAALRDLSSILDNQKLELKMLYFKMTCWESIEQELAGKFKNLKNVKTQKVEIITSYSNEECVILPYLDPGYLNHISMNMKPNIFSNEHILQNRLFLLSQLEQSMEADHLELEVHGKPEWFPIEKFMDCKNLVVKNSGYPFTLSAVNQWKKILQKSEKLKSLRITAQSNFTLAQLRRKITPVSFPVIDNIRRCDIPNTGEYWEIDFRKTTYHHLDIHFEKKKN